VINGLEGIPGSGKSYEGVVFQILAALKDGRQVITNWPLIVEAFVVLDAAYAQQIVLRTAPEPCRGVWRPENANKPGAPVFELFEDGHTEPAPDKVLPFGWVWDFYSDFKDAKGRGPLFAVDECHVPFPKLGTDPEVVQWFKLHRHFNTDVLLSTQNFRDMDQTIARLMHTMIRVRKADVLGRKQEYIRRVFGGYRGGLVAESIRPYEPQYFKLYKSHTQSGTSAEADVSDVAPFVVKFKRFARVWYAFAAVFAVWAFWPSDPKPKPDKVKATAKAPGRAASGPARGASMPGPGPYTHVLYEAPKVEAPDPLDGKTVHITGFMTAGVRTVTVFAVADGAKRLFDLTSDQLAVMGYSWRQLAPCQGWLTLSGGKQRSVLCDAPIMTAGTSERPVVVDTGQNRSSDPELDRNMRRAHP